MIALLLLAYGIGLLVGEGIREEVYRGKKGQLYSGLLILLKHRVEIAEEALLMLLERVWGLFKQIVRGIVRTHV
jgi:hypothetical protein